MYRYIDITYLHRYMIYIYIYILKLCGMLLFWTKATELEEKKTWVFLFLVRVPLGSPFNIPRVKVQLSVIAGKAWEVLQGQHLLRLCCQVKDLGNWVRKNRMNRSKNAGLTHHFLLFFWEK